MQAGLVADDQLRTAREARAQGGGTLGEHLVLIGSVDDDTLTEFYASRLVIPRIAPEDLARIPAAVLKRIPADMAAEFRVVPVAADGELNLTLAMSDPADQHVVDEVAFFTGSYVVRAVATQLQIAWCLAHYYGVLTPLARARLMGDGAGAQPAAARRAPLIPAGTPWEVEDEEETGPARMPLLRRKPVRRRTGELAPRSGTLDVSEPPPEPERLPAVVVDDEELTGQRTFTWRGRDDDGDVLGASGHDGLGEADIGFEEETTERRPSTEEPILLDRPTGRRPAADGLSRLPSGSGEILLLDQVKNRRRMLPQGTEPGLGQLGPVDSHALPGHDTESSRGHPWAGSEGESDTVKRQSKADRRSRRSRGQASTDVGDATAESMSQMPGAASAGTAGAGTAAADPALDGDTPARDGPEGSDGADATTDPGDVITDPVGDAARPRSVSGGGSSEGSGRNVDEGWDLDDGWGPRGSTIPPEYLGARPDTGDEDDEIELASGSAPVVDAAAIAAASASAAAALAALPSSHASAAFGAPAGSADDRPEAEIDPAELAAELERSSNRLLETLRGLERAPGRDEVVELLLDHLGASLRRRAFFAVKAGVLFAFRQQGASRPGIGVAELALDQPSTFGQVALNRLPYRGSLSPAAIEFVERALGSPGKGDAVVVPVAVRGRAVGLLYGDGLSARLFDEHQMVLGRAAGQALERILASRVAKA